MSRPVKFILLSCIFFILAQPSLVTGQIKKSEATSEEANIRLSWEEVLGAAGYRIMIKDAKNNVIIDKEVGSNHTLLEVPAGSYKIRIGTINKFSKVGTWSDWTDISVQEPEPKQEEKGKEKDTEKKKDAARADLFDLGLKLCLGVSYFYILPDWDKYYRNSYSGYSANIAYSLKRTGLPVIKYAGFEIESTYVKFDGKEAFNMVESDITNIITGANVFISTNFDFPLNLAVRAGGGMAYTSQEFQKYNAYGNPAEKGTSVTYDLFYKAGLSIEYRFYSCFFLEAYADYYSINYLVQEFKTLRFALLAGIRL